MVGYEEMKKRNPYYDELSFESIKAEFSFQLARIQFRGALFLGGLAGTLLFLATAINIEATTGNTLVSLWWLVILIFATGILSAVSFIKAKRSMGRAKTLLWWIRYRTTQKVEK